MLEKTKEAITVPAKYIFLDVVGFTQERSVEAQSDIVHNLNDIVRSSIEETSLPPDKIIFLPTGDGMCIALLNVESPYDIHVLIALAIVKRLHEFNEGFNDEMRKFEVRIGVNANTDNLVTDINGNRNIAGAGVSLASRIMNQADGNQILLGESVYDTLRYREKYMKAFKRHSATGKHDFRFAVYQVVQDGLKGLNIETPKHFKATQQTETILTEFAAYYFGHAIKNRKFFLQKEDADKVATVLLYFLALDSMAKNKASIGRSPYLQTYRAEAGASLDEQYQYYDSLDVPLAYDFADFVIEKHLSVYRKYFEGDSSQYCFISAAGVEKLRAEWPQLSL